MKKMRKGFTLVELLIVIAILGTLAAMMASSTGDATVRAKVNQIVGNIDACKLAATVYYSDNFDNSSVNMSEKSAADFLPAYIQAFSDYATGSIQITALNDDEYKGRPNWTIKVDFSTDADKERLAELLARTKGFALQKDVQVDNPDYDSEDPNSEEKITQKQNVMKDGKFTVNLTTGVIAATE